MKVRKGRVERRTKRGRRRMRMPILPKVELSWYH
jgi:hypothetical protein